MSQGDSQRDDYQMDSRHSLKYMATHSVTSMIRMSWKMPLVLLENMVWVSAGHSRSYLMVAAQTVKKNNYDEARQ